MKISSPSRRSPFSAVPSTVSAAVFAYTSAVSKVVIPSSSACRTHAVAASSSTWDPWVNQLPYAISEIFSPLLPRLRVCIPTSLARRAQPWSQGSREESSGSVHIPVKQGVLSP